MVTQENIQLMMIDDHVLFRAGLTRILENEHSCDVVAESHNVDEAEALISQYRPDIVLLAMNRLSVNRIDDISRLIERCPDIRLMMLAEHDNPYVIDALKVGADGFLMKDMDTDALIEALNVVKSGGAYIHPKVTPLFLKEYRRLSSQDEASMQDHPWGYREVAYRKPIYILTRRECDILQLMTDGCSNRMIGEKRFISDKTVKNHVSSILQKMNVRDRTQAVVEAIKKGWVKVESYQSS